MKVIIADNLTKIYPGGKKALDSVDLSVEEGGIFGFLGPNGAGKTTAVKLFSGMLQLTEGSCRVLGTDPARSPEETHKICGVVTEHAQMYNNLTGLANLMFFGSVFGINENETKRRAMEILERLSLLDAKDQKLREYSTGMRQKLSLARALIHQPKILFLDEPASGLDPESAQNVNNLIKNLARNEGTTVFLCTHQLRYAEEICTQYGLISEGKMLACGSPEELHSLAFSGLTLKLKVEGGDLSIPGKRVGIEHTGANCNELRIEINSSDEIPGIVRNFVDSGGKVYHVSAHKHSLEEIYFALIEKRGSRETMNDK